MYNKPLFHIFNRGVYLYGICIAVGIVLCLLVFSTYTKRKKMPAEVQDFTFIVAIIAIALGFLFAKVYQAIYDWIETGFKTFDFSLYSQEVDDTYGVSPYDAMQNIVKVCRNFIAEFDRTDRNLLFWGEPGLGKTFLSTCIAKELIKKGYSVIYETTYRIVSLLEEEHFNRSADAEALKLQIGRLYESDLLILDDLGAEFSTAYTNAALFELLNSRLIANKKTIINTNLSIQELAERYSDRVISRIMGSYIMLEFINFAFSCLWV